MPDRTKLARVALAGTALAFAITAGPAVMAVSADPTPAPLCVLGICPFSTPTPTPAPPPPPPPPPPPVNHASTPNGASSGSGPRVSGPGLTHSVLPGVTVDPNYEIARQAAQIESNPIASQRPDLMHFHPPQSATEAGSADPPSMLLGAPAGIAVVVAAALAGGVLAFMSVMVMRRRRTNPRQRRALVVAPAVGAVQAALLVALATGHAGAPAAELVPSATPSAEVAGTVLSSLRTHSVSTPVGSSSRTWGSLVSIESALTTQQDSLVTDEDQIAAITPQLNSVASAAGFARRPGAMGVLQQTLRRDVADHENQLSSFNTSLQKEYTFFVATAQSPAAAAELRTVAAHTPPDVENAITTDLNLVQTQLQQETEIAAASGTNSLLPQLLHGAGLVFHAPVAGYVSQPFGPTSFTLEPPITYDGVFYPHFHTGLDIAAPMDTPVHAAAAGVVMLATSSVDSTGHLAGYGNYVVIGHGDGFMTLYGHLDRLLVSPGQYVQAGQVIGLLGSTGWSTGPHVHFEIRKNGMYTDPAPYIRNELG